MAILMADSRQKRAGALSLPALSGYAWIAAGRPDIGGERCHD
jgi:hypothetical protein